MTIDRTAEVGKRFVTILEEWLTPEEFETVRTRNDARQPGICHSHDFCDANMAMDEAFVDVLGRHPDYLNLVEVEADPDLTDAQRSAFYAEAEAREASDSKLWGAAWDWAIEHYLSHSATAVELEASGYPEVQAPRYVCSGDGPANHVDCTFATDSTDEASTHFERTGHAVDGPDGPDAE